MRETYMSANNNAANKFTKTVNYKSNKMPIKDSNINMNKRYPSIFQRFRDMIIDSIQL